MSPPLYDTIGITYTTTRREDPRIAAAIDVALADARTVLNVGAGTGSYEPRERELVAVEPSAVMIAQRPAGGAPVVRAHAEALPFEDSSFDAAMTVLSDHHWQDRARGLRELRRVARRRVVVFTWDRRFADAFWLTRDYLPGSKRLVGMSIEHIAGCLGGARIQPVPVPHDCREASTTPSGASPRRIWTSECVPVSRCSRGSTTSTMKTWFASSRRTSPAVYGSGETPTCWDSRSSTSATACSSLSSDQARPGGSDRDRTRVRRGIWTAGWLPKGLSSARLGAERSPPPGAL